MAVITYLFAVKTSWPQQADQLDEAVKMVVNIAASLPEHVDQSGIILTVQSDVLRQLWTEAEVRDADHAAPGSGTFHGTAFGLRRLNTVNDAPHS